MENLIMELVMQVKQLNEAVLLMRKENLSNKEIFTLDEFCSYTGYEKLYVYKLVNQKKIVYHKTPGGKSLFFKKVDVINYITAIRISSADEMNIEAKKYTKK